MKRILLALALSAAFTAPAFALEVSGAMEDGQEPSGRATNLPATVSSGDLFIRSGDGQTAGGGTYLRGGPINLSPGSSKVQYDRNAQKAAALVYDPEVPDIQEKTGTARVQDYSATAYNSTQKGAEQQTTQKAGDIKDPFPAWFGTYVPPTLEEIQQIQATKERYYAIKDQREEQAALQSQQAQTQVRRTSAFGTTSDLKGRAHVSSVTE